MTTEHILIIDDSIAIASLLANEILPLGGYDTSIALSGEEGLETVRDLRPDLILCDLEMPGINGLDVLRSLQNEGIDIPAIMMTAFGSEAVAAQALRMGVKDYIIKPFTTEEILAAVERAMVESRLRAKLHETSALLEDYRQALVVLQAVGKTADAGNQTEASLSRIILAAVYGSGAKGGFIATLGGNQGELVIRAVANLPRWRRRRIPLDKHNALAQVIQSGSSLTTRTRPASGLVSRCCGPSSPSVFSLSLVSGKRYPHMLHNYSPHWPAIPPM